MASNGNFRPFLAALQSAPMLSGVTVIFGDERERAYAIPLPYIVITPQTGTWTEPAYFKDADPDQGRIWMTSELLEFHCYAASSLTLPVQLDHFEAVEDLRQSLLQALEWQQPTGLRYVLTSGRWTENEQGKTNAYSKAYVLSANLDMSIPDISPIDAPTPITATLTLAVSHG